MTLRWYAIAVGGCLLVSGCGGGEGRGSTNPTAPITASAQDTDANDVFSRYARHGADIWAKNPMAQISGEGQACISCHTSMPYGLVEPLLPGLARSRHLISEEGKAQIDSAVAWIDTQLTNPYPSEPRHNRHITGDNTFPEFRENIYANAGHMWSFLAKTVHKNESAPWRSD